MWKTFRRKTRPASPNLFGPALAHVIRQSEVSAPYAETVNAELLAPRGNACSVFGSRRFSDRLSSRVLKIWNSIRGKIDLRAYDRELAGVLDVLRKLGNQNRNLRDSDQGRGSSASREPDMASPGELNEYLSVRISLGKLASSHARGKLNHLGEKHDVLKARLQNLLSSATITDQQAIFDGITNAATQECVETDINADWLGVISGTIRPFLAERQRVANAWLIAALDRAKAAIPTNCSRREDVSQLDPASELRDGIAKLFSVGNRKAIKAFLGGLAPEQLVGLPNALQSLGVRHQHVMEKALTEMGFEIHERELASRAILSRALQGLASVAGHPDGRISAALGAADNAELHNALDMLAMLGVDLAAVVRQAVQVLDVTAKQGLEAFLQKPELRNLIYVGTQLAQQESLSRASPGLSERMAATFDALTAIGIAFGHDINSASPSAILGSDLSSDASSALFEHFGIAVGGDAGGRVSQQRYDAFVRNWLSVLPDKPSPNDHRVETRFDCGIASKSDSYVIDGKKMAHTAPEATKTTLMAMTKSNWPHAYAVSRVANRALPDAVAASALYDSDALRLPDGRAVRLGRYAKARHCSFEIAPGKDGTIVVNAHAVYADVAEVHLPSPQGTKDRIVLAPKAAKISTSVQVTVGANGRVKVTGGPEIRVKNLTEPKRNPPEKLDTLLADPGYAAQAAAFREFAERRFVKRFSAATVIAAFEAAPKEACDTLNQTTWGEFKLAPESEPFRQ